MIENYYSNIQFLAWTFLLIASCYFLFGNQPYKETLSHYYRSRKLMGGAFLVFSLQFFLQWNYNLRDNYPPIASALNISFFYMTGLLFYMSFTSLLDPNYWKRKKIGLDLSGWVIMSIAMALAIIFLEGKRMYAVLIASALFFFYYVVYISVSFIRTYRESRKKMENYYSEDTGIFIQWMSKSTFWTIIMGLLSASLAFAPKYLITIYLASSILMFFYIFVSFFRYIIYLQKVNIAVEDDPSYIPEEKQGIGKLDSIKLDTPYKPAIFQDFEEKLNEWIQKGGYKQTGITIEELARLIGTNRTYLSTYINSQLGCSFREWIVDLRLNDAKILLEQTTLPISQVATEVGYSSHSQFVRSFKSKANLSPLEWRKSR